MNEKRNKRQQQAAQTKERLQREGIRLFRKNGYENTKITDICQAAGVSTGIFYHYFPNKDFLFLSMYSTFDLFVEEVLSRRTYPSNLDALRTLLLIQFISPNSITLEDQRRRFQAQLSSGGGYVVDENRFVHTYVKRLIRQGIEAGEIHPSHDVEQTARLLFQVTRGILFDWAMRGGTFDREKQLNLALDLFLYSLSLPQHKCSEVAVDFEEYDRWKEKYYEENGWNRKE